MIHCIRIQVLRDAKVAVSCPRAGILAFSAGVLPGLWYSVVGYSVTGNLIGEWTAPDQEEILSTDAAERSNAWPDLQFAQRAQPRCRV